MRTTFTVHAFSRVIERLTMTAGEVASLIDTNSAVPIGRENGTARVHLLFYSIPDEQCFVAVRDEKNGEVITILPVGFHCRWEVSKAAWNQAKSLAVSRASQLLATEGKFAYKFFCYASTGRRVQVVYLGWLKSDLKPNALQKDAAVCAAVRARIAEKVSDGWVESVYTQKKGDDDPVEFHLP